VTAELVLGGHTHEETDRVVDGSRFVNPGSISNHTTNDKRARYLLLRADKDRVELEHRKVSYDVGAAVTLIHDSRLPGGDFLIDRYFS
jgi:predicted phosphodiesterase